MRERALFLVFIVFLSGLICSCSKENQPPSGPSGSAESAGGAIKGQEGSQMSTPPMRFQLPPLTDLHQLLTNGDVFQTRNVDISHAMVQRVFSDKQFVLVGPDDSHTVPVQLNGLYPQIKEGQEINVLGIVDPLGDTSQWNVLPTERQALAGHTMFIRAVSVKPSGR